MKRHDITQVPTLEEEEDVSEKVRQTIGDLTITSISMFRIANEIWILIVQKSCSASRLYSLRVRSRASNYE